MKSKSEKFREFAEKMDDREDTCFTSEEDSILVDMVRIHNVRNIKNRLELSAVWDSITEAYNKATHRNYAKKQLQKRLTNITYKNKKLEEKNGNLESPNSWNLGDQSDSNLDLERQKYRAEMAREMAELKRAKTEEIRLKKEETLLKLALANLKESEKRTELLELEIAEKKRKLS